MLTWTLRIAGVLLLALGLAIWLYAPRVLHKHAMQPLRTPFPIVTGQHVDASFIPELSVRHYIEITMQRNLPFERLKQIVGPHIGDPVSRPDIRARVESAGSPVPIREETCSGWGERVSICLGSFAATAGSGTV
jgi:hypothetical protein